MNSVREDTECVLTYLRTYLLSGNDDYDKNITDAGPVGGA